MTDPWCRRPIPAIHLQSSHYLRYLLLESKETRPVRELVVVGVLVGVAALVKELKVARVDG